MGFSTAWHDYNRRLSHWFTKLLGLADHERFLHQNEVYFVRRLRELLALCGKENPDRSIRVLDIGCGRHSHLRSLPDLHSIMTPYGMDISARELEANPFPIKKIIFDACDGGFREALNEFKGFFHLVMSHNFLEHARDPVTTHSMINFVLRPNGIALHSFPTLYDPLVTISHLLPTDLAQRILFMIEPFRAGSGKFKTYLRKCRGSSAAMSRWYASLGFDCMEYRDYYGTAYCYSIFPAQWALDLFYRVVVSARVKCFTSHSIVTLRKKNRSGECSHE